MTTGVFGRLALGLPGYVPPTPTPGSTPTPVPTPTNTYANTTAVRANRDGFRTPLLALQQRLADLES